MASTPQFDALNLVIDSAPVTSSSPSTETRIVPRRRFQTGRVFLRGSRWCGSFREYEPNPQTGKRTRHTITFDGFVTSKRAAEAALKPYLDDYNAKARADKPCPPPRTGKTVRAVIQEWTEK